MLVLGVVALAVFAVGGSAGAVNDDSNGADNGIHDSRKSQTHECEMNGVPTGDTITYSGPDEIWPPNHKYRNLTITAENGGADLDTQLSTSGNHDEVVEGAEMNGSGGTPLATDVNPPAAMASGAESASTSHKVRGERSGRGDGRTYTFRAMATFDMTRTCSATFTATVPHDQRG
jgi:hypothetical protein